MATRLGFRALLTLWLLGTAGIVAVPGVVAESSRPWDELQTRIRASEALLAGTMANIPPADQVAMARFARAQVGAPEAEGAAFVAAISRLPSPDGTALPDTSEWETRLAADPEAAQAFARTWPLLATARSTAERIGLSANDVYLTVDEGVKPGFYEDHIAFVLGAQGWWEDTVYPGQPYDITAIDGLHWRASYLSSLGGRPGGFGHNPVHDPILPRFETDEWGTWYSVWTSEAVGPEATLALTMDIEASAVREMMATAAKRSIVAILVTFGIVLLVARQVALRVSRPVAALQEGARAVLEERYSYAAPPLGSREFVDLIGTFNRMIRQLGERVNLLQTLEKLLSKELAETAMREGLQLGGKEAECTVLFTDFAGFSTITANMKAPDVVHALNDYFNVLIPIIKRHGGFVDKYIGDAIVAFFGAPLPIPNHADRALQCTVAMQRALRELNADRQARGLVTFDMRVGINSGEVVVGAIGCDEKLEYTSIGETTTLANRMESASPIGHACVAAGTRTRLREPLPAGVTLDAEEPIAVKGYGAPVAASRLWVDERRFQRP